MNSLTMIAGILALLGSAVIAGVFFAFSNFIMGALERLDAGQGMAAMQSINVVVLNPLFLGIFSGTAVVSLVAAGLAVATWGVARAGWFIAAALLYCLGTFVLTGVGNVPLNNQLEAMPVSDPEASGLWQRYLDRWPRLNTIRTIASMAAAIALLTGMLSAGGA